MGYDPVKISNSKGVAWNTAAVCDLKKVYKGSSYSLITLSFYQGQEQKLVTSGHLLTRGGPGQVEYLEQFVMAV